MKQFSNTCFQIHESIKIFVYLNIFSYMPILFPLYIQINHIQIFKLKCMWIVKVIKIIEILFEPRFGYFTWMFLVAVSFSAAHGLQCFTCKDPADPTCSEQTLETCSEGQVCSTNTSSTLQSSGKVKRIILSCQRKPLRLQLTTCMNNLHCTFEWTY